MTIRHNCKRDGCYLNGLPDWKMLNGCWGSTNVSVADIDGVVHQNGACLFIEKKFPKGDLLGPQARLIETLVGQGNSNITFWCERNDGADVSHMRVDGIDGYQSKTKIPATLNDVRVAANAWWVSHYKPGKM